MRKGAIMENAKTQGLSRRNFLGTAAAGLGALAVRGLAGCAPQAAGGDSARSGASAANVSWDDEYDVIVCGVSQKCFRLSPHGIQ